MFEIGMDKGMVASKLFHLGLGIQAKSSELSTDRVTSGNKTIETEYCQQRVEKLVF